MKSPGFVCVSIKALATAVWQAPAHADSAAASCQLRQKGSGRAIEVPCTFSQRQGYMDVTLQNGGAYSFTPGNKASGGIAVEDMARYCAGEASAKFKVSSRDIKTEKARQTQGMWEVWGQYPASPSPQVFICSYNAERQFLSADKYQP